MCVSMCIKTGMDLPAHVSASASPDISLLKKSSNAVLKIQILAIYTIHDLLPSVMNKHIIYCLDGSILGCFF